MEKDTVEDELEELEEPYQEFDFSKKDVVVIKKPKARKQREQDIGQFRPSVLDA